MALFFKTLLPSRDLRRLDLAFDVYQETSIQGRREAILFGGVLGVDLPGQGIIYLKIFFRVKLFLEC